MWRKAMTWGSFYIQKLSKYKNDKKSCQNLLTRKLVMVIMQLSNDKETCQKANENCQIRNNGNMRLQDKETGKCRYIII